MQKDCCGYGQQTSFPVIPPTLSSSLIKLALENSTLTEVYLKI